MSFSVSSAGTFKEQALTFNHAGLTAADIGKPVKITANMTVGLCVDNDSVMGKLLSLEAGGVCTVLMEGVVTMPYSGADPGVGFGQLVADATGGVKSAAPVNTGFRNFLILERDTVALTVTYILQH
jgi:hypothetical protein